VAKAFSCGDEAIDVATERSNSLSERPRYQHSGRYVTYMIERLTIMIMRKHPQMAVAGGDIPWMPTSTAGEYRSTKAINGSRR